LKNIPVIMTWFNLSRYSGTTLAYAWLVDIFHEYRTGKGSSHFSLRYKMTDFKIRSASILNFYFFGKIKKKPSTGTQAVAKIRAHMWALILGPACLEI